MTGLPVAAPPDVVLAVGFLIGVVVTVAAFYWPLRTARREAARWRLDGVVLAPLLRERPDQRPVLRALQTRLQRLEARGEGDSQDAIRTRKRIVRIAGRLMAERLERADA
jgi:hypothetical protein